MVYNEYVNTISFNTKKIEIMNANSFYSRFSKLTTYEVDEPDLDVSSPYFYELYVASQFYHALL